MFEGFGNIFGTTYDVKLKPRAVGKVEPSGKRNILLEKLKHEIIQIQQ